MIVYGQILCICLHANEGRESKTKDSIYNAHPTFSELFQWEKSAHYIWVNTVSVATLLLMINCFLFKPMIFLSQCL